MDVDFFNKNGYQVFENVIPLSIIDEIRGLLQQDAHASLDFATQEINCADHSKLIDVIAKMMTIDDSVNKLTKKTKDALSGHISLETRLNSLLHQIPYHSTIQLILKSILQSDNLYMHMPPTARFVLPKNIYAGVPPHQDIAYNKHMSNFITMWVPLVEITEECGGVIMYEGSGFLPEQIPSKISNQFWHPGVETDGFTAKHCVMKPGSILVLNKWIIHASKGNYSDQTRFSIDYRFFGENETSDKHYLDLQSKKVFLPKEDLN